MDMHTRPVSDNGFDADAMNQTFFNPAKVLASCAENRCASAEYATQQLLYIHTVFTYKFPHKLFFHHHWTYTGNDNHFIAVCFHEFVYSKEMDSISNDLLVTLVPHLGSKHINFEWSQHHPLQKQNICLCG